MCRLRQNLKSAAAAFPIRKGEDDLVKALNDALAKLQGRWHIEETVCQVLWRGRFGKAVEKWVCLFSTDLHNACGSDESGPDMRIGHHG